ncbi:coat F domain-containing protein [Orenia metallireducens]|jgi:spore coat protein CotF|uniref:Coat F domain-containing protein n=1 Tax=Orenia metallireducens TaxID=1413210 RepID=A0A285HUG6_9FIRM|nr:spore coat protein [Orenia metallireducens]PRX30982.1 coat F domain-containing protein [Orenia metallireducens]SNY39368.1 Coat F domain-containing protein [Orenia metallireducens]
MNLKDKDMAKDMLLMSRQMIQGYSMAEIEAANQPLRQVFQGLHGDVAEIHTRIFNLMESNGWYKIPVAGQNEIESEIINWEQKSLKDPELAEKKLQ